MFLWSHPNIPCKRLKGCPKTARYTYHDIDIQMIHHKESRHDLFRERITLTKQDHTDYSALIKSEYSFHPKADLYKSTDSDGTNIFFTEFPKTLSPNTGGFNE